MRGKAKMPNAVSAAGRKLAGRRSGVFHAQSGQSLIEVALIAPLLLVLVFGGIELGRFAYLSIIVGNAARAGAAYGSQSLLDATTPPGNTVNPGIQTAADNDFQNNGQSTGKLTVTSSTSCGCDNAGTIIPATSCTTFSSSTAGTCTSGHWVVLVNVITSATFNSIFKFPGVPSSITVTREVTMRVNQTG